MTSIGSDVQFGSLRGALTPRWGRPVTVSELLGTFRGVGGSGAGQGRMLDTLERFGVVRGADRIDGRSVMEGLQVNGIGDEFVEPAVARSLMGDSSRAAQLLDEGAPAVRTFGERATSNPIYNGLLAQAMLRDGDVGDVVRVTDDIGHVADDVIRVADDVAPDLLARAVAIGSADDVARAVANLTPGRLMTLADGVTHALRLLR